jgi:hypothetical protein
LAVSIILLMLTITQSVGPWILRIYASLRVGHYLLKNSAPKQCQYTYLSDLKLAHKLRDLDCSHFDDFFTKAMIKGAGNLLLYTNIVRKAKFVLTFPLLKLLGHEVAKSDWSVDSKRVFWAACCLAFFGSFRLA